MAQNFLYMFEFVVDDLLITRPNLCAPEEYPTCCELTFRSHVFVSICDKEFGGFIETAGKSGKCCLFSLETPIKKSDHLQLHIFKKRTEKCKFLIGATEIPVYRIFDKVTQDFYLRNPNWDAHLRDPKVEKPSTSKRDKVVIDNDCGADQSSARKEELFPTYELTKKLLALTNLNGSLQTGNIVLIMRLTCMGPTIVSPFPFGNESAPPVCPKVRASCQKNEVNDQVMRKRYFSANAEKGCVCGHCEDECDRCSKKAGRSYDSFKRSCGGNASPRGCPCPDCDEACQKGEGDDTSSDLAMKPCVKSPTRPVYGPEKYDEFEANLNGSGLTIRVLKDSHIVKDVCDAEPDDLSDNCSIKKNHLCDNIDEFMKTSPLLKNHIGRRTGGNITNNKSLPIVRGNIKYSGNDACSGGDSLNIPLYKKIPHGKAVDTYRKVASDTRNCCFQVEPTDIDNTLRGINATARKKGIEVCYKTCEDPDTDVFLVRLGKKKVSQNKKNTIEVELRTPKEPPNCRAQKWTKGTQVDETLLDANMKKKGKGKKGKRRSC